MRLSISIAKENSDQGSYGRAAGADNTSVTFDGGPDHSRYVILGRVLDIYRSIDMDADDANN